MFIKCWIPGHLLIPYNIPYSYETLGGPYCTGLRGCIVDKWIRFPANADADHPRLVGSFESNWKQRSVQVPFYLEPLLQVNLFERCLRSMRQIFRLAREVAEHELAHSFTTFNTSYKVRTSNISTMHIDCSRRLLSCIRLSNRRTLASSAYTWLHQTTSWTTHCGTHWITSFACATTSAMRRWPARRRNWRPACSCS